MRKYQKSQCIEMIKTLEEAHGEIAKFIEKNEIDAASALLGECQEAAISLGNIVEATEGEGTDAVSCLEAYCEMVYRVSEEIVSGENYNPRNVEKRLKKSILKAQSSINALPTKLEAVFLPYKASMWDSLESIWMAADEDPNCDAYVIPIPYYDRNPDGSFAQIHYEAEDFPDYVPVTHYGSFDFEQHQPDMIFIHNPYDEYNYVTSVHPNFYSYNLEKYTDCLVYVPYYATSGKMSEGQAFCPSYMVVDYIVVQSKSMIEQFDEHVTREKFLPLGSPKFDRVIRLCKNPPEPPEEWKKKMEGKKVFFYNTSISGMLENTENFLKKLKYVFDTFKQIDNVCILWRPHPLLQSTFESMRQEYLDTYDSIIKYYKEENVGILDTTPDIEASIALCDAYIGDGGSSIISLFQIAGKEIFILNNEIHENTPDNWWQGYYFFFPFLDSRLNRYVVMPENKLYYYDQSDDTYKYLSDLPGGKECNNFGLTVVAGQKAYIFPTNCQEIEVIEDSRVINPIRIRNIGKTNGSFSHIWVNEKYVFIIPKKYPDLIRFEIENEQLDYVRDVADFFWRQDDGEDVFCGGWLDYPNDKLYFLDENADNLLSINCITLEKRIEHIGYGKPISFCGVENTNDTRYVWFLPKTGTRAIRWDNLEKSFVEYDLNIPDLVSIKPSETGRELSEKNYFGSLISLSDHEIVFAPNWANKFVKLDISNRSVAEWAPPFKVYTENISQYFYNWGRGYFSRSWVSDEVRWVSAPERVAYNLNMEKDEIVTVKAVFSEKDIYQQYGSGFKATENRLYCLWETWWNPLYNYLSGKVIGDSYDGNISDRVSKNLNAGLDGCCGKHIYEKLAEI